MILYFVGILKYGVAGNSGCGKSTFCHLFQRKHRNTSYLEIDDCHLWKAMDNSSSMWDYAVDMKSNYSQQKPMSEKSQKLCKFVSEIMLSHIKYCEKNVKPDIILFDWFLLPYLNMWENLDRKIIISADNPERYERILSRRTGSSIKNKDWAESDFIPPDVSFDMYIENNDNSCSALNKNIDCLLR